MAIASLETTGGRLTGDLADLFTCHFFCLRKRTARRRRPLILALDDRDRSSKISTFDSIKILIKAGEVRVSEHGWDELESDDISVRHLLNTIDQAELIEDFPESA